MKQYHEGFYLDKLAEFSNFTSFDFSIIRGFFSGAIPIFIDLLLDAILCLLGLRSNGISGVLVNLLSTSLFVYGCDC